MTDTRTNRNWLIAGLVISIVFVILIVYFVTTLVSRKTDRPPLGHRSPAGTLEYCGADLDQLCIVSFSQNVDGSLQVNFQIPSFFYPDFFLTIDHNGQESRYECKRGDDAFTTVICTGATQVPGQMLVFKAYSKESGILLAEGQFAIIGIALITPEGAITATAEGTETPTETVTGTATLPLFETPPPTETPTSESYPNPTSYP